MRYDGKPFFSDELNKEIRDAGLLDEELKISNKPSIKDIMISPQWLKFHRTLIEQPENAPGVCHRICGKPNPSYLNGMTSDADQ